MPLEQNLDKALFIGDSPNDEPMFGFFQYSVGVANIQSQLHRLTARPKYVTPSKGGAGFVEMANHLLALR
jgi:hydroxymethylpyrimidine pyrophosphatase-like HAD family hydrolase